MQSSQALQQPSNATHHQQVASPEAARAAAEIEAQRHAKQVNDSEKTENRGIQDEEREKGNLQGREGETARADSEDTGQDPMPPKGSSEPGKGEELDLLA